MGVGSDRLGTGSKCTTKLEEACPDATYGGTEASMLCKLGEVPGPGRSFNQKAGWRTIARG